MSPSASTPTPYAGPWLQRARDADAWLAGHKVVVSATTASLVSTFAGFPLDSLKSRLQSSRENLSMPRLAAEVIREEGIGGLWRGFPLPLITISIVRTISFTIYSSTKRILNSTGPSTEPGAKKPWIDLHLGILNKDSVLDVATTSFLGGAASGAVVCVGSAPFELVKVRRQLEYQIYRDSHPELFGGDKRPNPNATSSLSPSTSAATAAATARVPPRKAPVFAPPTTMQAVRMIVGSNGVLGLWTGFRLHFVRDTLGTALYFAEYDVMRYLLGRKSNSSTDSMSSEQGALPRWASWLPPQLVPFLCGSFAGVTSWALIYPVDAIKTKAQQRALSNLRARTPLEQFLRLVRGTDLENPKPLLTGIARLYRGLGVSMVRSMLTHGLLWTLIDWTNARIDAKPCEKLVEKLF